MLMMPFNFILLLTDANWGSSNQAEAYNKALRAVKKLNQVPDHVKNYRPQILVLSGHPSSRSSLVDFASCLTKKISLLVCGEIQKGPFNARLRQSRSSTSINYFRARKIHGFYELVETDNFYFGAKSLMELSGIGKLRPNVLFLGYKGSWKNIETQQELLDYFNVIQ